jgi:HlyD family secretion protein
MPERRRSRPATRTPAIIVGVVAALVVGLSLFYLLRPEPLLVQGEAVAPPTFPVIPITKNMCFS